MKSTTGKLASIVGRYFAMDRDKRWERVKLAYDAMVNGVGEITKHPVETIEKSYAEGITDEFFETNYRFLKIIIYQLLRFLMMM